MDFYVLRNPELASMATYLEYIHSTPGMNSAVLSTEEGSPASICQQHYSQSSPGYHLLFLPWGKAHGSCSFQCPSAPWAFSVHCFLSGWHPSIYYCKGFLMPLCGAPWGCSPYFSSFSRSLSVAAWLSGVSATALSFALSVKLLRVNSATSSRLLQKTLKRISPSMDNWDTPLVTGPWLEFMPLITTLWIWPFHNFPVHLHCLLIQLMLDQLLCEDLKGENIKLLPKSSTALPSSNDTANLLLNVIRLVKNNSLVNPCWLLLLDLYFTCLEMVLRISWSITFSGFEVRLTCLQFHALLSAFSEVRSKTSFPPFIGHLSQLPWSFQDCQELPVKNINQLSQLSSHQAP